MKIKIKNAPKYLVLAGCEITEIRIKSSPNLEFLDVSGNPSLQEIDLSKCPNLLQFRALETGLRSVDFAENHKIEHAHVPENCDVLCTTMDTEIEKY